MKLRFAMLLLAITLGEQSMALEKPEYEVLFEEGNIEYRMYKPYLVAETEVTSAEGRNEAANEGFMRLFNYITGDNTRQAEIAMTAPVQQAELSENISMTAPVQQVQSAQGWRIAFMLPSKYTLADAPIPTDARVSLRAVPGRLMAVVRYSGRWTTKNVEKYTSVLMESIAKESIKSLSEPETAAYNPPFMPPFMRRNEVMMEVASYPQPQAESISRK